MSAVLRRLVAVPPTLAVVVVATFALTHLLPGDPAAFFTSSPGADSSVVEATRRALGLDEPLWRQFAIYLGRLAQGDLGQSVVSGRPVLDDLARRLPASAELTLAAMAVALAVALPLGARAAARPGGWVARLGRLVAALGGATPTFVTGLCLILLFYYAAGLAPAPFGRLAPALAPPPHVTGFLLIDAVLALDGRACLDALAHLALPAATLALFAAAPLTRVAQAATAATLASDYVRAARANGLSRRRIALSYVLRNAAAPILTTAGLVFTALLGAGVLVERVFAWPGVGAYALDALIALDHSPVQGFILAMATISLLVNLAVDVTATLIDPRLRLVDHA
ncbi:MAG: ABC transporter permease [Rhizobiales bacterium]|nr:ABC transporter permease [Hyphomicrobiales bacterium]